MNQLDVVQRTIARPLVADDAKNLSGAHLGDSQDAHEPDHARAYDADLIRSAQSLPGERGKTDRAQRPEHPCAHPELQADVGEAERHGSDADREGETRLHDPTRWTAQRVYIPGPAP